MNRTHTRTRKDILSAGRWLLPGLVACVALACESPDDIDVDLLDAQEQTEAAGEPRAAGNIAVKSAVASSVERPGLEAAKAFDGKTTTRWSSSFADPQWIYVDLGTAQPVNKVVLNWENAAAKSYRIQTSTNATAWTTVATKLNGTEGVATIQFSSVKARYVRMYGMTRTTPYGYSLYEFEVYGDPATDKRVPGTIEAEAWDRMTGFQTQPCKDSGGGLNVGWTDVGDWLEYDVTVSQAGDYVAQFRVAGFKANAKLHVSIDGVQAGTIAIPNTGAYQAWTTVKGGAYALSAGSHAIRLTVAAEGFNLNWFKLGVPVDGETPGDATGSVPALKVVGSKLTDMNGNPVQLKGLSAHQLQNFPWGADSVKNLVKQYGVNLVRAAMYIEENGYKAQPALMKQRAKLIIDSAIANGVYVIIDWHIMGNPNNYTAMAKTFFHEIAAEYGSTANLLYEIVNEPTGVDWAGIKGYAEQVIPVIRAQAPNAVVIVGTPNYDTLPQDAWANKLGYSNIMYTVHFYCGIPGSGEYADKGQGARNNVKGLIDKGMPIFITEWGTSNYDGAGGPWPQTADLWIEFMKANKISWAFWSFANGGGGDSFLKKGVGMNGPWTDNDLNPPGAYIKSKFW